MNKKKRATRTAPEFKNKQATRIFVTANYKDPEKTPLENYNKMHEEYKTLRDVINERKTIITVAAAWEEYGEEGNAHIHALLQTTSAKRLWTTGWAKMLKEELGLTVNPHIDIVTQASPNEQIFQYRL